MTTPTDTPENETESLEELQTKKDALLRQYQTLKAKHDLADNDCERYESKPWRDGSKRGVTQTPERRNTMRIAAAWTTLLIVSACGAAPHGNLHPAAAGTGPDSVEHQLHRDRIEKSAFFDVHAFADWNRWRAENLEARGLSVGADYNALILKASESPGERTSASGALRFYGSWELLGRGTDHKGGIVFKVENRHAFTPVAPNAFGAEIGYAGVVNTVYGNQNWRTTQVLWRQYFREGNGMAYLGYMDTTDFTDSFTLASPWCGFGNMVFENGSGTIGGLPDGALGVMFTGFVADDVYATAAVVDANGNASDLGGETAAFFDDFETFKTFEIGWMPSADSPDNFHLTFWQIDASTEALTPAGWGVAFSASGTIAKTWTPFLRGGWSYRGGSTYEAALATGFGYRPEGRSDLLGVGLSVSRPNENTYHRTLDDQYTAEIFYRWQLTHRVELTPSLQIVGSPALNPTGDTLWIPGFRARVLL